MPLRSIPHCSPDSTGPKCGHAAPRLASPTVLLGLGGGLRSVASAADEQFVFNGFTDANLSLDGTATVTPEGLLMLTNGTNQLKGHAFYPAPLRFHRAPNSTAMDSFSTAFVIGIIGAFEDFSTHGMAFVIAKSRNLTSALPGKFLGLVNSATNGNASNHLFAVEFDTFLDSELNDMSDNHVGIDVNGLNSVAADNAGYYDDATGAFRNMSLVSRKAMQVWVDFDGQTMQVNVTMAPLEVARPRRPLLSTIVNLSSVIDDDTAYVGFSSATSILFCRHYVLGWSLRMNGAAPALNTSSLPSLPSLSDDSDPNTTMDPRSIALQMALAAAPAAVLFVGFFFLGWEATFGPHMFSYKDLLDATDGFSDTRLLGIGGHGKVYRGALASKVEVAVKKMAHGPTQGTEEEFVEEVLSIGRLRHGNLVQLLGYCWRDRELLLVYDYMPNGSLDEHLYDQGKEAMSWSQRFSIIKGVAAGLLHLHEGREKGVVHRGIKPSNVLLDGEMNGRLGEFRLARPCDDHRRTVRLVGYMAPELGKMGEASTASDVFAFGALMLEVACGREPVVEKARDNRPARAGGLGARPVARRLHHGRGGPAAGRRLRRRRGEPRAEAGTAVLAPAGRRAAGDAAGRAVPGRRRAAAGAVADVPGPEHAGAHAGPGIRSIMSYPMTSLA